MLEGRTSDGIMFQKVNKKTLQVQTDRVDAIKYFKSKNIKKNNDLIKDVSVWVEEQIGLKKRDYREKKRTQMETQNSRRYKETGRNRKLADSRLERRIEIEEKTKSERTI